MNISSNTRNAIKILFELEDAGNPLPIARISERTGVPYRAVENVHLVLKQHGITGVVPGGKGGIVLKRPLSSLNLGHLIGWFESDDIVLTENKASQKSHFKSPVKSVLDSLAISMEQRLNAALLSAVKKEFLSTSLSALGHSCLKELEAAEACFAGAGRFHPVQTVTGRFGL